MVNGFVHIVESPSPRDFLDGRTEGRALSEALTVACVPHTYNVATNFEMLVEALGAQLRSAVQEKKAPPILHFSAHGNSDGIGLTSGEFVRWDMLERLLQPIQNFFPMGLLICLSACESSSGMRMAMTDSPDRPFWALVSHMGKPTWGDCAVGYIAFYNRFFKGHDVSTCVDAMKAATGDYGFAVWHGEQIKANWLASAQQQVNNAISNPSSAAGQGLGQLGLLGISNLEGIAQSLTGPLSSNGRGGLLHP